MSGKLTSPPVAAVMAIRRSSADYPAGLGMYLGDRAPETIHTLGNLSILREKKLAFFCSVRCPGDLILKIYDLARRLRDAGVTVASGFHSPMEKECLTLLLRGRQPVIICPAKRLSAKRLPKEYAAPLAEGRLLLLSPFGEKVVRVTEDTARVRSKFVAALAEQVFVAYAAPGSKTELFCRIVLEWRKPLLTLDSPDNAAIVSMGACPLRPEDLAK